MLNRSRFFPGLIKMTVFKNIPRCALTAILPCFCVSHALAAKPSVDCNTSGQTITAAINALTPAPGYQQINVSGTCKEAIYIPPELAVSLVGAKGARIVPPTNATGPTIGVAGKLFLYGMTVTSTSFTAIYLGGQNGGVAAIVTNSTLDGPGGAVNVSGGATVQVQASKLAVTGTTAAIQTYNQGVVEVDGYSSYSTAAGTTISSTGGSGIGCYGGGNVVVNAYGGTVAIKDNGGTAIDSVGCNVQLTGGKTFVELEGNKGFAALNMAQASSLTIDHVKIEDNAGLGIYAQIGSGVQISGAVTISGNGNTPLQASSGAILRFVSYAGGINTIGAPSTFTGPWYGCYQGGKIYVDQIANIIQPAPTSAELGCLQVGGP